jgi:hypothetical protein
MKLAVVLVQCIFRNWPHDDYHSAGKKVSMLFFVTLYRLYVEIISFFFGIVTWKRKDHMENLHIGIFEKNSL